jgi:dTDP-4-dehydrorhamnose 3,5-epimerase
LLDGVKILELNKNIDERGFFGEIFRKDWPFFDDQEIVQGNLSVSYPGIIRAWHRHKQGQVDHFLVLRGAIKICAYDEERQNLDQIISSGEKLQLVRIPGFYWHGFKNVGNNVATVIYFANRLYDYKEPDEERRAWNDPNIIDPMTGESFDWNAPPYR